ncbi:MAG TPA: hypothetical protein PKW57_03155 [Anaerolineaceae bacterium]|jgi:hypothetical protein|nr:hypothetical protein [Anaerolineaceae bacterium]HPS32479.1 hypothetical protein [Anaerolineaceae bacterium]
METHFYLSLLPEALIVSMLNPEEFGSYYAVGSSKKSRGQAMFFEVDPNYQNSYFHLDEALKRCVPHEDGRPKSSIYVSVYRVLEHIDPSALLDLYLTTQDGRTLALKSSEIIPDGDEGLHLYQEIAPVTPLVVSRLDPLSFYDLIVNNPTSLISVPAITFAELQLGELASDPEMGLLNNLPYSNPDHLRQCLSDVKTKFVSTKMVDRTHSPVIPYRTIKNGFFVGNQEKLRYYPMPSAETLRAENYRWFRSASM